MVKAGAADLRAAAEVIRVKGHCKNVLVDSEGHVCLLGAIMDVARAWFIENNTFWIEGLSDVESALTAVVAEQFPDRLDVEAWHYVAFNNHPDTTPDEVIAVLEKAAARLEEAVA